VNTAASVILYLFSLYNSAQRIYIVLTATAGTTIMLRTLFPRIAETQTRAVRIGTNARAPSTAEQQALLFNRVLTKIGPIDTWTTTKVENCINTWPGGPGALVTLTYMLIDVTTIICNDHKLRRITDIDTNTVQWLQTTHKGAARMQQQVKTPAIALTPQQFNSIIGQCDTREQIYLQLSLLSGGRIADLRQTTRQQIIRIDEQIIAIRPRPKGFETDPDAERFTCMIAVHQHSPTDQWIMKQTHPFEADETAIRKAFKNVIGNTKTQAIKKTTSKLLWTLAAQRKIKPEQIPAFLKHKDRVQMVPDVTMQYCDHHDKLNVALAIFNLLPIHPLDGGKIFVGILPEHEARDADLFLRRYGMLILFFLIFPTFGGASPISLIISPIINFIVGIILPNTQFI